MSLGEVEGKKKKEKKKRPISSLFIKIYLECRQSATC